MRAEQAGVPAEERAEQAGEPAGVRAEVRAEEQAERAEPEASARVRDVRRRDGRESLYAPRVRDFRIR